MGVSVYGICNNTAHYLNCAGKMDYYDGDGNSINISISNNDNKNSNNK